MPFISAGYTLIHSQPYQIPDQTPLLLPSPCDCVNRLFPDTWALSWTGKSKEELELLETIYGLGNRELEAVHAWSEQALAQGRFGWPHFLDTLDTAREFYRRFLRHNKNLRLIGLFLPEEDFDSALTQLRPKHPKEGPTGLYLFLLRHQRETEAGETLGYDILGLDYGSFHSFYCNYLQKDYQTLFKSQFNQHHLFSSYADAMAVLPYTQSKKTGAEPGWWNIWKIKEFSLYASQGT